MTFWRFINQIIIIILDPQYWIPKGVKYLKLSKTTAAFTQIRPLADTVHSKHLFTFLH